MRAARPGSTPSSPSYIGRATKSTVSSSSARSGVTTTHWMEWSGVACSAISRESLWSTILAPSFSREPQASADFKARARPRLAAKRLTCLFLPLFGGFFHAADVHEGAFGKVVPFAVAQLFEAADRLGQRRDLAGLVGERLGNQERLRQELLDPASAVHDLLVFFAQLLDAEDGDDVLQLAVTLQNLLHTPGHGEMLVADVLGAEDSAVRR